MRYGCSTTQGRHHDAQKFINLYPGPLSNSLSLYDWSSEPIKSIFELGTGFPINGLGFSFVPPMIIQDRKRRKIDKKNNKGKNLFIELFISNYLCGSKGINFKNLKKIKLN